MGIYPQEIKMIFNKNDIVCLKTAYLDDGRNFRAGDKGTVVGHDAFLIRVRMLKKLYTISVQQTILNKVYNN
jgi:hypothetical protein